MSTKQSGITMTQFNTEKGRVLGAVLLIAGSCIGAGMLALPVLTGFAGFIPTFAVFIFSWLFMTATALLYLEANLWMPQHNILTLTEKTVGKKGKLLAWITFLFLFYSLLVAYIVKGGEFIQLAIEYQLATNLPDWFGSVAITVISALSVYFGTWIVDHFNRICMIGLFLTYFYLLGAGFEYHETSLLAHTDWSFALFLIPFIVIAFGFHNMIPSISDYLHADRKKTRNAVILGGLLPFAIYLLWILKIQMIVPLEGEISLTMSHQNGEISTEPLARLIQSPWISIIAQGFAFFAIITSLLGQALSVVDFLADGLHLPRNRWGRLALCLITFIPPYICAHLYPAIFFKALEFAGGVATMILFGILPPLIVWVARYKMGSQVKPLLKGGRPVLALMIAIASIVLVMEILKNFNLLDFIAHP